MRTLHSKTVFAVSTTLFLLVAFSGCSDRSTTAPERLTAAAKADKDPTVKSTDPTGAPQETTLDVEISGSGFDDGSQAAWQFGGVASVKVITNSTRFVNPRKLIANITIAVDADLGLWDVEVTTARRKKGIGTELFEVKPGGGPTESTPLQIRFRDLAGDKIVSDDGGPYVHGVCGVRADFPLSGSGDVTFDADDGQPPKGQDRKTCGFPRFITLRLNDPVPGTDPGPAELSGGFFMNVDDVESVTVAAGTVMRNAQFNTSHCRLEFSPDEVPGSNLLLVTQNANGSWTIETQPAPNDVASCADGVRAYHMPFGITVQLKP